MKKLALVIDDQVNELETYKNYLVKLDYDVLSAKSLIEAKQILARSSFDLVLTDLYLNPDSKVAEGLEVIKIVKEEYPQTLVIAMSSDPDFRIATKAKALGAGNFVRKPIYNSDEIAICIESGISNERLKQENHRLETTSTQQSPKIGQICPDGIVLSDQHRKLVDSIAKNGKIPVTIFGETGTGKEVLAKLIHQKRVAKEGQIPLVSVNCANLEGDLVASILFGHKKGAFSGADKTTSGLVGAADGGILFLDEIHALTMSCQQKLLRVLNDGTYTRLGDTVELRSSFQVIVASTKDLDDLASQSKFLLDLRMRLTGIDFELLPLRARKNEIELLIRLFFANKKENTIEESEIKKLAEKCKNYYWQGNIRQLFKILELMTVMADFNNTTVKADHLPVNKTMLEPNSGGENISSDTQTKPHIPTPMLDSHLGAFSINLENGTLDDLVCEFEQALISHRLKKYPTIKDVFESLNISRSTLEAKRKKYSL